jgi:uncharacterized protein YkwD
MRFRALAAFAAALISVLSTSPPAQAAENFEEDVLAVINYARTHPQAFARQLRDADGYATWAGDEPGAVDEAITFLMRQPPLPPLRWEARLGTAARDHADAQGWTGQEGHVGPRGETFSQRMQRVGLYAGLSAESISYGQMSPEDVVRQLIVDSGVRNRGHRRDIFSGSFQAAGVGCGEHARYGAMCVIQYAGAIVAR